MDEGFYRNLLDQIADGVYFVTRDRRISYWNVGAERITGYDADEVVGHSCSEGILRHVNDRGTQLCITGCPLAAVMRDGRDRSAAVYLHHKDGHRVPVTVRGHALYDDEGKITGSVEVFTVRMATEFASSQELYDDGALDPVTGLPPRRFGEERLRALLSAVHADAGSLGVLFLDVDRFKSVNDTYGHAVGDEVLRMVGQSLANGLSRGDVPVRWGGEEFLALVPDVDQAGLEAAAERVRMLIENSWLRRGDDVIRVTASLGATMAESDDEAMDLIERADRLMYESKTSGRNRVTTDHGVLTSDAPQPITAMGVPWEMPQYREIADR